MVKSTNDNQIIPFVLKLEVKKLSDSDFTKYDLAEAIFRDRKLNEGFNNIGFEFEKQSDMQFDIESENQYEIIKKKGTYSFDIIEPNGDGEYNELFIQLYFTIFDKTENISQKLKESLYEIIKKNFKNENLIIGHDDLSLTNTLLVIQKFCFKRSGEE